MDTVLRKLAEEAVENYKKLNYAVSTRSDYADSASELCYLLCRLLDEDQTNPEVTNLPNLTPKTKRGRKPKYTDDDISLISDLRSKGYSYGDISAMIHIPKSRVYTLINTK